MNGRQRKGVLTQPPHPIDQISGSHSGGGFVNGRINYFRDLHFGRAVQHSVQGLEHLRIARCAVGFRVLLRVPETDCGHIQPAGNSKGDFILETVLLPQHGNYVVIESAGELAERVRLKA